MRIIVLGILAFLLWLAFGNYWYLCKIRQECGDSLPKTEASNSLSPKDVPKPEADPNKTSDAPIPGKKILSVQASFSHKSDSLLDELELSSFVRDLHNILAKDTNYQKIILVGNTDAEGDAAQNYRLGLRRSYALKDFLVRMEFEEDKIEARSLGELDPIFPNNSEINKERNRRIDIYIQP